MLLKSGSNILSLVNTKGPFTALFGKIFKLPKYISFGITLSSPP
jgi:hypothetical protein